MARSKAEMVLRHKTSIVNTSASKKLNGERLITLYTPPEYQAGETHHVFSGSLSTSGD